MDNFISFNDRVAEVKKHFQHQDTELARRRFLDLAFDQDDLQVLQKATAWSKKLITDAAEVQPPVLAEALEILDSFREKQIATSTDQPLVAWENISKRYSQGNFSLNNIHLSVFPGSIVGVVGENGNGKTTLLRCIAGQLEGGIEPNAYSYLPQTTQVNYAIKQYTGFIPQRIPRWYGKLSDNLHFSASIAGIKGDRNQIMVDYILERFGLSKFAELNWNQISSGYRTRFEIARVVLQRPALLVLDEPLANLDINAQQTLLQDLRYIAKSHLHPMGVLLSSQQLYEIEKVSDRVLFIKNGSGMYNDGGTGTNEAVAEENKLYVLEFECKQGRDEIERALEGMFTQMKFNGGVYQLTSSREPDAILKQLMLNDILPAYYRDITNSTKRFF